MWSRWRCVTRMCISPLSGRTSSARIPVPASRISVVPSESVVRTHAVLPPYRAVDSPGTGTDPLTPRSSTRMSIGVRHGPERQQAAADSLRSGQRKDARLDLDALVVPAPKVEALVRRTALTQRGGDRLRVPRGLLLVPLVA